MVQFIPVRCAETSLPSLITDGALYVTTDTKKLYVDISNERLSIQDIISVTNEASLPQAPLSGKLYVALAEGSLWIYSDDWIELGGGSSGYVLPIASADTLGGIKIGENLTIEPDGTLNASSASMPSLIDGGNASSPNETYEAALINTVYADQDTQPLNKVTEIIEVTEDDT